MIGAKVTANPSGEHAAVVRELGTIAIRAKKIVGIGKTPLVAGRVGTVTIAHCMLTLLLLSMVF